MSAGLGSRRQASLQTCLLNACSSIHGGVWLGLVHEPLVSEFASFESRRTGLKEQGVQFGARVGGGGKGGAVEGGSNLEQGWNSRGPPLWEGGWQGRGGWIASANVFVVEHPCMACSTSPYLAALKPPSPTVSRTC